MKNICPFIVATLIAAATLTPARAQEQDTVSVLTKKEQRTQQRQEKKLLIESKRIQYHHDFRVGVGMMAMGGHGIQFTGPVSWSAGPNFYMFYGYRIVGGLKVSLTLGYGMLERRDMDYTLPTNIKSSHYVGNYRISPSVQYEWYRRGLVTMYSDIGFTWNITSTGEYGVSEYAKWGYITPNLTPFGITVGNKHWFGAAEVLSLGSRGLFNLAVGYRF